MNKKRFYYDEKFLASRSGRPIRLLAEYLSPLESFKKYNIDSTVVFFGSARIKDDNTTSINNQETQHLCFFVGFIIYKW